MDINGQRYDNMPAQRYDIGTTAIYVGYAVIGSVASAKVWTIKKIALTNGSPVSATWTAENGAIWDNRATESFS